MNDDLRHHDAADFMNTALLVAVIVALFGIWTFVVLALGWPA